MKGFIFGLIVIAVSAVSSQDANAQGKEPVFFEAVRPVDVLSGVGLYIKDVGAKTVKGAGTVLKGTGQIITSPFRAKTFWPRPRVYRYERGYFVPPRLEMLPTEPPKIFIPESNLGEPEATPCIQQERLDKFIPVPYFEPESRSTIALLEIKF